MKKSKIVLYFCLSLIVLSYGALSAHGSSLNLLTGNQILEDDKSFSAGITPDSGFYFLDVAPDTIPSTVWIEEPSDGSIVSRTVNIKATAVDNVAVTSMELYIDGKLLDYSSSSSLSYTWNTKPKSVASGPHLINVRAYDSSGNVGSASITVLKL